MRILLELEDKIYAAIGKVLDYIPIITLVAVGLAASLFTYEAVSYTREAYVVDKGTPLTVQVITNQGLGSGVWVADDLVLTAKHVIKSRYGDRPTVANMWVKDSQGTRYKASLALEGKGGSNVEHDWALLRVEGAKKDSWATVDCARREIGERIIGIGNALGYTGLLPYIGDVQVPYIDINSNWRMGGYWKHAILTNMDGAPGVSGGPVFDMDAELVGLMVGGISSQNGGTIQQITYPVEFVEILCGDHVD